MKALAILCTVLLALSLVLSLTPTHGEEEIYDSVIRLHVLAESDDPAHQADKLAVRDAILPLAAEHLRDCKTRDEAAARLQEILPILQTAAAETIAARVDASSPAEPVPVAVTLTHETYPTRTYDGFCFPAGTYLSLRVLIGQAEGQNWWCVLFPSLCLSAAQGGADPEQAFISVGLTPEQYRVITESDESTTYRIRFKLLETLQKWREARR